MEKGKGKSVGTFSIISVERAPRPVISDSEDPRMDVILEKPFLSSLDESIKFQSSNSLATVSFSCIFEGMYFRHQRYRRYGRKEKVEKTIKNNELHYLLDASFPFSF